MTKNKPNNPFVISGYREPAYFCDRQKELRLLHENLTNERNTVLHAWRRLGKTSLLRHLITELETTKKWDTIYVDLLGTKDIESGIKTIVGGVYTKYGKVTSGNPFQNFLKLMGSLGIALKFDPMTGTPELEAAFKPTTETDQSLNKIGQFLAERKRNILVVLDEFQQVAKYDGDGIAEAQFRSFMQTFPGIRFIFSGSERNLIKNMFQDPNRPFYKSCSIMGLEPIEKKEYFPFIKQHFKDGGKVIDLELLDEIYTWSRAQTYTIQLLCNRLYASSEQNSSSKLQRIQLQILEEESPIYSNIFNLLSKTQWQVLKAIAYGEPLKNHQSKEFLSKYQLGAASSVATAIKTLVEKEIVIKDGDYYLIHEVQLARWIQRL